ncbi:MSMEG_0569 family flavin-dependent oxidoreductase [Alcanivorax jadensis]|uniref:MSMEG_0569 family flavin-dependent oxidoreductase n=1 Tax=Alcanivorax jadensis TaxID=64988 RepID=UPI00240A3B3A|nr:MSMEG_0569 family flavin-dependent oxidoreductase [Alcanivorax jadensis]MDF1639062.1 MSMEG_0569 family flavin-dependent oxidoreductase [Alcanivorax jadensis]
MKFPKYFPVIIIGAGQAGLSMSYHLKQKGVEHCILEKNDDIAHGWRNERWDSFCLVSPNWQCQLPGYHYSGDDPHGFMVKEEIVEYFEGYRDYFNPPIIYQAAVDSVTSSESQFLVSTSKGSFLTDHVVVAAGCYHIPNIPDMAQSFPSHIKHVHSRDYRNPSQLPEGDVMVVGTGQSGAQIAEDLHLEGRQVHLCVGNAPRVNRFYRGKDVVDWLEEMGYYNTTLDTHPDGENAPHSTNHYVTGRDGGRDLNFRIFAEQGMKLYGPLKDANSNTLYFENKLKENLDYADSVANRIIDMIEKHIDREGIDAPVDDNVYSDFLPDTSTELTLSQSNINTVVWATGFKTDFSWLKLPVFDENGRPKQKRGVTEVGGIYFLGLNWMHTWGSGRLFHVGQDAQYLESIISNQLDIKYSQKKA